ncbi:unnamed protein product, partial [marine sediment metagenome]
DVIGDCHDILPSFAGLSKKTAGPGEAGGRPFCKIYKAKKTTVDGTKLPPKSILTWEKPSTAKLIEGLR